MAFIYCRTIRFQETDAAGVVYFANLLSFCHEAYEASLAEVGIPLRPFFSAAGEVAVPIVRAEANFYQPMFCGDAIAITLIPRQLSLQSFEVNYVITAQATGADESASKPLAQALTQHVCISISPGGAGEAISNGSVDSATPPTENRRRQILTPELMDWIERFAAPVELEAADD